MWHIIAVVLYLCVYVQATFVCQTSIKTTFVILLDSSEILFLTKFVFLLKAILSNLLGIMLADLLLNSVQIIVISLLKTEKKIKKFASMFINSIHVNWRKSNASVPIVHKYIMLPPASFTCWSVLPACYSFAGQQLSFYRQTGRHPAFL